MPPAQAPQEVELTAPTTRLPATTRMLGPPERTYHSTDDARRAARSFALHHGYDLGCRARGGYRRQIMVCYTSSKSLFYQDEIAHEPSGKEGAGETTKGGACQFEVRIRSSEGGSNDWDVVISKNEHNHAIDYDIFQRAQRILKKSEGDMLRELRKGSTTPSEMLEQLNQQRAAEDPPWPSMPDTSAIERWLGDYQQVIDSRGTHKIPVHSTIAPEDLDVDRSGQAPAKGRRPRRPLPQYEPDDILSAGEKRFWRSLRQLQGTREWDRLKYSLEPINVEGVRRDGPHALSLANATWYKHLHARKDDARKATTAKGHDGFAAIATQMVTGNGWALREKIWDFLGSQQGTAARNADQFNVLSADERDAARCRMFPHGVMPSFLEGQKMMRSKLPIGLWLWTIDFWLVAEYLKRPICVDFGSTKVNNFAFTFLPVARGSPRPPQAIGLAWSWAGWTPFEVPRDTPLPPISIGGWGSKVNMIVSSEEHRYWHRNYRFMDGGGETRRSCICLRRAEKAQKILYL